MAAIAPLVNSDLSADEDVLAILGDLDRRIGNAAQVERRIVGEALCRDVKVDVADQLLAQRDSALAVQLSTVHISREARQRNATSSRSTWALRFSAMLGSSLINVAFITSTELVMSGALSVPRASSFSVESPRRGLVGHGRQRRDVEVAVDGDIERSGLVELDATGSFNVASRSGQMRRSAVAAPWAMAIVAGCCGSKAEAAEGYVEFWNVMRPSMAATSASVALSSAWALIFPLNCGGAPGIADGSSPVRPALRIAGPLMRGISTGAGSNCGRRPETSILAVPQFAANCSTSASPLSIRARRTMSENWLQQRRGRDRCRQ